MFITNHDSFHLWWHEILSNIKMSQNIMTRIVDCFTEASLIIAGCLRWFRCVGHKKTEIKSFLESQNKIVFLWQPVYQHGNLNQKINFKKRILLGKSTRSWSTSAPPYQFFRSIWTNIAKTYDNEWVVVIKLVWLSSNVWRKSVQSDLRNKMQNV